MASGPKPSATERRYPRYAAIEEGAERRRTVIRLHADGWNAKSIAEYLDVSRKTVHAILRRFAEEQFAGLPDKSHARKQRSRVWVEWSVMLHPSLTERLALLMDEVVQRLSSCQVSKEPPPA